MTINLEKELVKFENQYKVEMKEYNEPLERLMKKRSQYKIKQKKDIQRKVFIPL